MPEIKVVLLTVRWQEEYVSRLKEHLAGAEVIQTRDDAEIARTLARADVAMIAENVRRYRAGETMLNLLTTADIYTHG